MIGRSEKKAYKKMKKEFYDAETKFFQKYPYLYTGKRYVSPKSWIVVVVFGVAILVFMFVMGVIK